jgi:hypothetical protein
MKREPENRPLNWPLTAGMLAVAVWVACCGCDVGPPAGEPPPTILKTVVNTDGTLTDYLSNGKYQPDEFQPADGLICVNWDICPEGVVRWADQQEVPVLATYCRATFPGLQLSCGACIDTRSPACAPYRGRCMAPNWPAQATDYCGQAVSPPDGPTHAWTLCTGSAQQGPQAQAVCGVGGP